jgi:hypothetical protein
MLPFLQELGAVIDDLTHYEMPERLPNGRSAGMGPDRSLRRARRAELKRDWTGWRGLRRASPPTTRASWPISTPPGCWTACSATRRSTRRGRIMSFAGLRYYQNTTDAERAKFLSDCQDKITTFTTPLVFFTLEINRIDDARSTR